MEDFSYRGEWWFPENPDRKIGGTLHYSDEKGLRLDIARRVDSEPATQHRVIIGVAERVGDVLLWHCDETEWTQHDFRNEDSSFRLSEFRVQMGFLGYHVVPGQEIQEPAFTEVSVGFSGLTDWMTESGLSRVELKKSFDIVDYDEPAPIETNVNGIRIDLWPTLSQAFLRHGMKVEEEYHAYFTSDLALTVENWMTKAILPFRDLLAFASGYPSQIESIEKISMPEELVPGYNPRIRVVFKPWKAIGEAVTSQGSWRDVRLFGLTGSQYTDWNRIVNTWFHLRNEIDSVLGLYLVSIYRRDQFPYLEAEFLNAIQALESFHDRLRTKNRSSRKRRPTLAERIGDLLEEQQAFLKPIIPDFTSFQASVKDTRNFFTHYNEELEKRRLQPLELIDAIDTIWVLLQVLIMEELGIPRETARKNVAHTRRYRDIGTRQIISYS